MTKEVEFFFDFVSPYTYLASTRLEEFSQRTGAKFKWRPFLLGGVFQGSGNQAQLSVKPKFTHMITDLNRWARYYGVPLQMPSTFPIKTITSLRMALAAEEQGAIEPFSHGVFKAFWAENKDISNEETLVGLAADAGLDGKALFERVADQEIKDRLRANTDEAVSRGAFGAPTFFADNEMFWGNDRLFLLELLLKREL